MKDVFGLIISILGRDRAWRLGRALYMRARGEKATNAISENGEAALVRRMAAAANKDGSLVFFDVGANLGEWTSVSLAEAAAVNRSITVHVFEPTPAAATRLKRVLAAHAGTVIHQVALSDRSGTARFAVYGQTAGTNSLETDSAAGPHESIEVVTATGADFAKSHEITAIDLVKIDTEGHDYSVLAGFEPLMARSAIGALQFEYNSRWLLAHRGLRDVFDLASRTGYKLGRVTQEGIELYDRWNPECDRFFEDNFALVRPDLSVALGGMAMSWSISNTLEEASG